MLRDISFLLLLLAVPFGIGIWILMKGPGSESAIRLAERGVESGWLARGVGIGFAVLVIGAVGVSVVRAKATPAAWERFAERHGLEFLPPSSESALGQAVGLRNGREVHLGIRTAHGLHRRERRTWMELSVEVRGAPQALGVLRNLESPRLMREFAADVSTAMGVPGELDFGDREFDDAFSVRSTAADEAPIRDWLIPERRSLVAELLAREGFVITRGRVAYQDIHPLRDESRLRELLDELESAARRLEENER